MKEDLNLLPPTAVDSRRHQLLARSFNHVFWYISITLLLIVGLWAGMWYDLRTTQQHVQNQLGVSPPPLTVAEGSLGQTHIWLSILEQRLTHPSWTPFVAEVLTQVPSGITLTRLALTAATIEDHATNALTVAGSATDLAAVAAFEQNLKSLPDLLRLEAPLQNLANPDDTAQTFSFIVYRSQ